jgi:hypothetical protein
MSLQKGNILAYSRIIKVFPKNIKRMYPICLTLKEEMDMSIYPSRSFRMSSLLWTSNITTLVVCTILKIKIWIWFHYKEIFFSFGFITNPRLEVAYYMQSLKTVK